MLAVTGGKGGSGKTTTALGIAVTLSDRRREPIVIDADVDMPNLHIRAGVEDSGLETLACGGNIGEAATESDRYPGVSIVGATPGTDLEAALRNVVTDRPVILDGAAGASERAVTPLRHAERAVVVSRATPASVTDAVKSIRMSRGVDTPVAGVLLSRVDSVSEEVLETLGAGPAHAVPTVGQPVTDERARHAYDEIADAWANA
ncbi:MAG: cobyrinic acid ac-diamide synthase [Halodesulfurarchaeum sp.]|nr:cobyrinic acid ac-diamide synthase [Halodesulfurarchaeum sp.]